MTEPYVKLRNITNMHTYLALPNMLRDIDKLNILYFGNEHVTTNAQKQITFC